MTALARHGTHNQKSHGNRLGKPSNVAGKTGLGKATAKLEGSPEEGPDRAPATTTRKLTAGQTKALNVVKDAGPSGILVDEARKRGAHENSLYALKRAGLLRTAWIDEGGAEVEPPHKTGKRASLYWFTT